MLLSNFADEDNRPRRRKVTLTAGRRESQRWEHGLPGVPEDPATPRQRGTGAGAGGA